MATMYYRPYSGEPSQDDTDDHRLPPHHAVDSVLPEYQYIFMDQPNTQSASTSQRSKTQVLDLDKTQYTLLDQQMRELDRYRLAVGRMGKDIIQLRQTIRDLETSNSMNRRELGKYNDATRYMLDSSELDGLNKPELAARYMTLKQTLSTQTDDLAQYKERVQKLQNELIKKNEKEREFLKLTNAHVTQNDVVQRLQEHVQREKDLTRAFKKQEEKIRMYEKMNKKGPDPVKTELMDQNSKLRTEVEMLKREMEKSSKKSGGKSGEKDEEKLELYEMLDNAEGRIMSLEKQLAENARNWGREKMELKNRLRDTEMGFTGSTPGPSEPDSMTRRDQLASSSRKLKPIVKTY